MTAPNRLTEMRFYLNIDHVATVRQARGTDEPDPVRAAVLAELAGVDGITVHLREDRRHIHDRDVRLPMETVRTGVTLERAATPATRDPACDGRTVAAQLAPALRGETPPGGGLDLSSGSQLKVVGDALARLEGAGIRTSLFIDPTAEAIQAALELGADAIELHTGEYANAQGADRIHELDRLGRAASLASKLELAVHAGHGLTYENVHPVAAIPEIEELNIGHSVIARAVLTGMERSVKDMSRILRRARRLRA